MPTLERPLDRFSVGALRGLVTGYRDLVRSHQDVLDAAPAAVESWMPANRPGVEVEVHDGGQPLHPYLLGIE